MTRWIRSVDFGLRGIVVMLRTQPNARIEATVAAAVVGMGLWLGLPLRDWAVLVCCMSMVMAAEAMNTAIESATDRCSPDHHPLAARAKDAAAGAVLLTAIGSVIVGVLILGPPLWQRLHGGW